MELMDLGYFLFVAQIKKMMANSRSIFSSLADISRNCGPIRIDVLGKIAEVVLGAITYLYSNFKVMHRNLKPSKILLNSLGQIKLSDFRASGELMNSIAETVVGSAVCYMAPERIRGESYTIEAEVWSFGLTIIELAIGKFPYQVTPDPDDATGEGVNILDLLQHIALGPAPKLPESDAFPDILRQMIEKCVQKDPQDRSNPVKLYVSVNLCL
jgi:mitogen-activated protein kinase kinase